MKSHVKIVATLVAVGLFAVAGYRFGKPIYDDWMQQGTSDARGTKGNISIGVDNWVGYFPLCSSEMKKRMRRTGYLLQCDDDGANYGERMQRLADGDFQFAVATVDSYLLNASKLNFPATIIAVIDESKGGDALVAWVDQVAGLDDLKSAKDIKVALTPASPSEHLIKSLAVHFDIEMFGKGNSSWRRETDGSSAALELLKSKQVEAAVLWEPDVTRALDIDGVIRLLGTEDTQGLIVDILLVNRRYAERNQDAVLTLLSQYFRTLKYYRENQDSMSEELARRPGLSKKQVANMLKGVSWANLYDNAQTWFAVAGGQSWRTDGLADSIDSTAQILMDSGDFSSHPVPNKDAYRLINSQYVQTLYENGLAEPASSSQGSSPRFSVLNEAAWGRLRPVGTLKVRPIVFRSGTGNLTQDGKLELDQAYTSLKHYPNFRLLVNGHTGLRGNTQANLELSQQRAEAVLRYLRITYDMNENRMKATGFGSKKPLARKAGESNRAYQYRLPRVELVLATEDY